MNCAHNATIERGIRVKTVGSDLACILITSTVVTRASPYTNGSRVRIRNLQAYYVHYVTTVVTSSVNEVTMMPDSSCVPLVVISLACASRSVKLVLWFCTSGGGAPFESMGQCNFARSLAFKLC